MKRFLALCMFATSAARAGTCPPRATLDFCPKDGKHVYRWTGKDLVEKH